MKHSVYALLLLALSACGGSETKNSNHLFFTDFEGVDGWTGLTPSPSLNREKAHSGAYSIKVDPTVEYSLGYNNVLNRLGRSRADVSKTTLHGWAYVPSGKDFPQIVMEVVNPTDGKQLQREFVDLHKEGESKGFGKWIEFSQPVTLTPTATAFSQVRLYLWRGNSPDGAIYVDDLSLDKGE